MAPLKKVVKDPISLPALRALAKKTGIEKTSELFLLQARAFVKRMIYEVVEESTFPVPKNKEKKALYSLEHVKIGVHRVLGIEYSRKEWTMVETRKKDGVHGLSLHPSAFHNLMKVEVQKMGNYGLRETASNFLQYYLEQELSLIFQGIAMALRRFHAKTAMSEDFILFSYVKYARMNRVEKLLEKVPSSPAAKARKEAKRKAKSPSKPKSKSPSKPKSKSPSKPKSKSPSKPKSKFPSKA